MFFTNLETDRLELRNVSPDDAEFVFQQFSDPAVCEYLYDEEPFTDVRQAIELIGYFTQPEPRNQHRWVIVRKADGALLGTCGFHRWNRDTGTVDTGYDLRQEHWGRGYMTEAMQAILAFARTNMNVRAIDAEIFAGNPRSIALAEKLGFKLSRTTVLDFKNEKYLHNVYTLNCS